MLLCFGCTFAQIENKRAILKRINSHYSEWLEQWHKKELSLKDLSDNGVFKTNVNVSIQVSDKRFQDCSPFRRRCIDIYSGSYEFVEGSNSIVSNGEPESLIILSENNTDSILLRYGYSILFQESFWNSNDEFVVLGCQIGENSYKPLIWVFDLRSRQYSIYSLKNVHREPNARYILKKFNGN